MKILIALDESAHSEEALEFVTRMRWPAGSRVILVNVMQPVVAALAGPYEPSPLELDLTAEQRRMAEELVAGAESRLREYGFATEGKVLTGDPREALTQEARKERADLIVMGSHGRTGIAKLMLGSVSSHVVTHAPCSVMVVKSQVPGGVIRRSATG